MKIKLQFLKRILDGYKRNVHIVLPLLVLNIAFFTLFSKIPYLNIYPNEFSLILIIIDWVVYKKTVQKNFNDSLKEILSLFLLAFFFDILNLGFYAELVGDAIYTMLFILLGWEFTKEYILKKN